MAMAEMRKDDDMLDLFFAAGRAAPPEPSAAFLARVAEAGLAAQRARQAMPAPARRGGVAGGGILGAFLGLFGGWGGIGGMATAAAAGLWLGLVGSDQLAQVASGLSGADTTTAAATNEAGLSFLGDGDILALAAN